MFSYVSAFLFRGGEVCSWSRVGCLLLVGGGSSGPQPRGEVEGDLVQAHTKEEVEGVCTPPQQTATAVAGTHPTGMHSCFEKNAVKS